MTPTLVVLCFWLLFGGTHLALGSPPLRDVLVRRLGERRFALLYTAVAAITLTLLAAAVARFGGQGVAGAGLTAMPAARWALAAMAFAGAVLTVAGFISYFRSPMAFLRRTRGRPASDAPVALRAPSGVERITRHPFFVGTALLMGAHALMAGTLAGAVYFAGFVVLALAGIPMQDRKFRALHGGAYANYEAATSALPFASQGVSRSGWRWLIAPVLIAAGVVLLHPLWRLGHGAAFALLAVIGGLYAVARQFRLAMVQHSK
ncbi:MAG TPA: NnrU family protein [Albitalea sp.]|uniref:NnrU family protein n=1 Tax=Piscinibacter sp. TaxID=1903157 RepID=UPI002ED23853